MITGFKFEISKFSWMHNYNCQTTIIKWLFVYITQELDRTKIIIIIIHLKTNTFTILEVLLPMASCMLKL